MSILPTDPDAVCVVGSGPVGLAFALRLADAGRPVVLIDSGPAPARYSPLMQGRTANAAHAADCRDDSLIGTGTLYSRRDYMVRSRHLGSGGTSRLWCVKWRPGAENRVRIAPSEEADFAARPGLGNPGWQVPGAEICGNYDAAMAFFGLAGHGFDSRAYSGAQGGGHRVRDNPLNLSGSVLPTKLIHFARADTVFETRFAEACRHPGITVCSGLHLVGLDGRGGRIEALRLRDGAGGSRTLRARHYVLALGGIETVRHLLLAREDGVLSDPHDVFGRWFSDHPHTRLGYLAGPQVPDLDRAAAWYDFQMIRGTPVLRGHEIAPEAARREGLLRFSLDLIGRPAEEASPAGPAIAESWDDLKTRHWFGVLPRLPRLAAAPVQTVQLLRRSRQRFHNTGHGGWSDPATRYHPVGAFAVEAMFEQRPSADNRIRLARERDALGLRRPVLQWAWSRVETEAVHRAADLVGAEFERAGLRGFRTMRALGQGPVPRAGSGFHHMGGARQSADPAAGVVDARNRVHGVANLTLIGTSVFPNSAGYANPTLTAVADAMRVAALMAPTASGARAARRVAI